MAENDGEVTRSVDLDASPDAVWEAVADPGRRETWLDDDEATGREVRVDSIDDGRSLAWTWWHPDDPATASRVEIVLTELASGGTRVAVTERLVARPGAATMTAQASVSSGGLWDRRLLGLELLFVGVGLCVG